MQRDFTGAQGPVCSSEMHDAIFVILDFIRQCSAEVVEEILHHDVIVAVSPCHAKSVPNGLCFGIRYRKKGVYSFSLADLGRR